MSWLNIVQDGKEQNQNVWLKPTTPNKLRIKDATSSILHHRVQYADQKDFKGRDAFVIYIDFGLCCIIDFHETKN